MRIVHLFKDFDPPVSAGITRYLRDVADATAAAGNEVEVHVAGVRASRREVLPSGVVVHRHGELGRALSSPISPGLALAAARVDGDVLHVHTPNPIVEAGIACNSKAPLIVSFHAQLGKQAVLEPIYGPLQRRVLARAAAVLVSSETMAGVPELAHVQDTTRVLPYGVSPRVWPTVVPHRRPSDDLRLLFLGRLVYYKGLEVLLDALALTAGTTLTLVGEGPLRAELTERAERLAIADRVRFLGHVGDEALPGLFAASDAFVMPSVSKAESFGMAMSEAMASGLPAVSTALGTGTDWVNLDGVTGLVVPPGDAAALAGAIRALADDALRARLGAGARARVESELSFAHHVQALLDLYRSVAR